MGLPSVPSVPSVRPVRPSRPDEPGGLRTLLSTPPSPVHPGRPGPAWTWILSNHSQNPALLGSGDRARTAEDTVTRTAKGRPLPLPPEPCEPLEPRGPFWRGGVRGAVLVRVPGPAWWGVVYPRGMPLGHAPGVHHPPPCRPGYTYEPRTPHRAVPERASGLKAARRAQAGEAGKQGAGKQGCRKQGAGMQGSREAGKQ